MDHPLAAVPSILLAQESEGFVPKLGQVRGDDARYGVLHHGDAFQGGYFQAIQLLKGSFAFARLSLLQQDSNIMAQSIFAVRPS